MHNESPQGCDYDIFEEFPDGSTIWRAVVFGRENVESKLQELSAKTSNKLFAMNLTGRKFRIPNESAAQIKMRGADKHRVADV